MVVFAEVRVGGNFGAMSQKIAAQKKAKYKEAMNRWGHILERDLKTAANEEGIQTFTGDLQGQGIRYVGAQKRDNGQLLVHPHVLGVDRQVPHTVPITKNSAMLEWAKQARFDTVRAKAARVMRSRRSNAVEFIYVKPHPFLEKGKKRALRKLPSVLKQAAALKR